MTDELLERLRNPIGFAVLHTEAMQAVERIEKAEAECARWRTYFFDIHKDLTLSLIARDWQSIKKTQMKMWKICSEAKAGK